MSVEMDEYLVLRALQNPKWDFRSIEGLCKETRLNESQMRGILYSHRDNIAYVPGRDGRELFTLKERVNNPTSKNFWVAAGLVLAGLLAYNASQKTPRRRP